MEFPLPNWVFDAPNGLEREQAIDRFLLHLASLYASRECTIRVLSELIDINYQTLKTQAHGSRLQRIPLTTCEKLEELLGPQFRRHRLRETRRLVG